MPQNRILFGMNPDTQMILRYLKLNKKARFNELFKVGIMTKSQTLARRVRKLCDYGFLNRNAVKDYYEVWYSLTPQGNKLYEAFEHLI